VVTENNCNICGVFFYKPNGSDRITKNGCLKIASMLQAIVGNSWKTKLFVEIPVANYQT